ncbi:MAG: hypothetical protein HKN23_10070 [Verrucomicrobiales bacterium]|nr:hypothetical protein [Verrucomicrobiales bacterium]
MAKRANVSSVEALDQFRVALLIFIEKATLVLDEVGEEVKRTRIWLQSEQPLVLDQIKRRKQKQLEMLEQEYFTARMSALAQTKTGAKSRINRVRRELRSLEDTMRKVKGWVRNFDSGVEPFAKKVDKLRALLELETVNGVTFLNESIRALSEYAAVSKPGSPPPESAPDSEKKEEEEKDNE